MKVFLTTTEQPKNWWAMTFLLLLGLGVGMYLIQTNQVETAEKNVRQEYGLEGRILLNQLQEQKTFNTKESWDLNEWVPIRNQHMQQHYNLLLQYDSPSLTSKVRQLEDCLKDLAAADVNHRSSVSDKCNEIGETVESLFFTTLSRKAGEAS